MAMGYSTTSGGDFLPIIKYDARAGRMFRVDRVQTAAGWEKTDHDITGDAMFAVDFRNAQVGWIAFTAKGPDFRLVKTGEKFPDKPSDDYKQGFRVRIWGNKLGGWREFSHTAKSVLAAIDALHDQYLASEEAKADKLPVIRLAGTTPITTTGPQGKSTNYAPVFDLVQWIDRPADNAPQQPAPVQQTMAATPPAAVMQQSAPAQKFGQTAF